MEGKEGLKEFGNFINEEGSYSSGMCCKGFLESSRKLTVSIQKTNGNRGMWLCCLGELASSVSVQPGLVAWPDVSGDGSKGRNLVCSLRGEFS